MPRQIDMRPVQITHHPTQRIDMALSDLPKITWTDLMTGFTRAVRVATGLDITSATALAESIRDETGIDLTMLGQLIDLLFGGMDFSNILGPDAFWRQVLERFLNPAGVPILSDLVRVLTGIVSGGGLPDIEAWAQKLLGPNSPLNAANLFGTLGSWLLPLIDLGSIGQTAPNLIPESDFADPITIDPETGFYHDPDNGHDGAGCAAYDGDSTEALLLSEVVPVTAGQKIEAGAWASTENGVGGADSLLVELVSYVKSTTDTSGWAQTAVTVLGSLTPAGTSPTWVKLGGTYTVPAGVDGVAVRLHVTDGFTSGTARFDDCYVRKVQKLPIPFVDTLESVLAQAADTVQAIIDRIINAFQNLGQLVDTVLPVSGVLDAIFGIFDVGLGARTKTQALEARIRQLESAGNTVTLDFEGGSTSSLGAGWTVTSSGGGAGDIGQDGKGNLVWKPSGVGNRTKIARYDTAAITTDNGVVEWILASSPQSYIFDDAYTYVCFRMKDSANYCRVRSGYNEIRLQAVVGGVVSTLGSPWSGSPKAGDQFSVHFGEAGGTNKGTFVVVRNGAPIITTTDATPISLWGADYRRIGVGMETGNRLVLFQNIPAGLGVVVASEVL